MFVHVLILRTILYITNLTSHIVCFLCFPFFFFFFVQVLETCVKNCGHRFHVYVCTRDFVEGVLVQTILPKNNPPMVLHDRILSLIQVCTEFQHGTKAQCFWFALIMGNLRLAQLKLAEIIFLQKSLFLSYFLSVFHFLRRGPTLSGAFRHCLVWCVCTTIWRREAWSFLWLIWMLCHPYTPPSG